MVRIVLLFGIIIIIAGCRTANTALIRNHDEVEVEKLNVHKINSSTLVVKPNIIISVYMLSEFTIDDIKTFQTFRRGDDYPIMSDYLNLSEYQFFLIETDKEFEYISQNRLNKTYKLKKKSPIYLDGFLLTNRKYKIAKEAIVEIEIVESNNKNKISSKVLNIWTLQKEDRDLECLDCLDCLNSKK